MKATKQAAPRTAKKPMPENVIKQEEQASITVQDIAMTLQVIDVASSRGAFNPTEFENVGMLYKRLNAFVAAVTPKDDAEENAAVEGE